MALEWHAGALSLKQILINTKQLMVATDFDSKIPHTSETHIESSCNMTCEY